jgi:hypothetical protein
LSIHTKICAAEEIASKGSPFTIPETFSPDKKPTSQYWLCPFCEGLSVSHRPQSVFPKPVTAKVLCAARQIATAAITRTAFFISLSRQTKFIGQCADSLCGNNAAKGLRRNLASPVQLGANTGGERALADSAFQRGQDDDGIRHGFFGQGKASSSAK